MGMSYRDLIDATSQAGASAWRLALGVQEGRASISLDGDTQAAEKRESPGYGCPECGERIPLEDAEIGVQLITGLRCCGAYLDGEQAARLLKAARLIEEERQDERLRQSGVRNALDRYGRR